MKKRTRHGLNCCTWRRSETWGVCHAGTRYQFWSSGVTRAVTLRNNGWYQYYQCIQAQTHSSLNVFLDSWKIHWSEEEETIWYKHTHTHMHTERQTKTNKQTNKQTTGSCIPENDIPVSRGVVLLHRVEKEVGIPAQNKVMSKFARNDDNWQLAGAELAICTARVEGGTRRDQERYCIHYVVTDCGQK